MNNATTPLPSQDPDEFLGTFHQFMLDQYVHGGIRAADIGIRWGAGHAPRSWIHAGFERLSLALNALVQKHPDEWRLENAGTPQLTLVRKDDAYQPRPTSARPPHFSASSIHVPEFLWRAIVDPPKADRKRYYQRSTGQVQMDTMESPEPLEDWVAIEPIPQAEQRGWAKAFLDLHGLSDDATLNRILEQTAWFSDFCRDLQANHSDLLREWKKFRVTRIFGYFKEWMANNRIDGIHQTVTSSRPLARVPNRTVAVDDELRNLLLKSIDSLSTNEILDLRLPVRALVQCLRPDLLR